MNGVRLYLRVLSILFAAALLVLGVLVVIEVILAAVGKPPWLLPYSSVASTLRDNAWSTSLVRLIAAVLCLIGLLLLVPALKRGKPTELPLTDMTDGVQASVDRKGLERALRGAAQRVDGISKADASVSRRSVSVTADTPLKDQRDLPQQVEQHVRDALGDLSLAGNPNVKVATKGSD